MLQKNKPIRRYKRPKPRRDTPRRSSRVRDLEYMDWVRSLPCYASVWLVQRYEEAVMRQNPERRAAELEDLARDRDLWTCAGPPTADHVGRRGLGQKSSDLETICLCLSHHLARQQYRGLWKGYDGPAMRHWNDVALEWTNGKWMESHG
jgi:hypothetical protein